MRWKTKLITPTAWEGHMQFGMEFVRDHNIKSVVEIGVCGGHSLFSFAEGMEGREGQLIGIDTWAGDINMGSYEGDAIYESVKDVASEFFPSLQIKLYRKTSNQAKSLVKNDSVDLLHIDAQHDYKSVKADFDNYLPKVKKGGYIMLHDTQVNRPGFEVGKLFNELKQEHSEWEFSERLNSFGLGIIKLAA